MSWTEIDDDLPKLGGQKGTEPLPQNGVTRPSERWLRETDPRTSYHDPHCAGCSAPAPANGMRKAAVGTDSRPGFDISATAETRGDWHAAGAEQVLAALGSTAHGLSHAQAVERLERHGPNTLPAAARRGPAVRLLLQFHNVFIYILLGSAGLSFVLGHAVDAGVILAVVLANAAVGFVQEGRAERALDAIRGLIDPKSTVLRDGRRVTLSAADIVPGDVVLLEPGDKVPADLRLLRARGLRIDEAALTGESLPVEKTASPVPAEAGLADRGSMAYLGTFVGAGQGAGVAVATGAATELGRISTLLGSVESGKTPLIRQMDRFGRQLTGVILAVAAATFCIALLLRGYPLAEAFMAVIGLSVAAIPEGLPAIMTITLAIGVRRMAARHAIVRRLPAVETLGSVSVICTDKTGTLTRNEMMVTTVVTADGVFAVSGTGYAPEGALLADGAPADLACVPVLAELVRAAILCNDAELRQADGTWRVEGDPMEGALLALAHKAGAAVTDQRQALPRTDEVPFDAGHRFMATLHHSHEHGGFAVVKGAPEVILAMCEGVRSSSGDVPLDAERWHSDAAQLAATGQRVLAFAVKPMPAGHDDLSFDDLRGGAVLLGLVGIADPPREEAIDAVRACRAAGIRVIMITGDHAETARAIAAALGLDADPVVVTGRDIDLLDASSLQQAAREAAVFARTTPEHKLRLVEALQSEGLVVAMTGDGVNDAPALKRADVGVAMGGKGTEVAKEAAEIVLADDNFASIAAAVREGRTVYDNLTKVIGWTMPTSAGEGMTILAAIALGLPLPITPVQILWINMITAVALGLTLAFEPTEPGTMQRPPRAAARPLLNAQLMWQITFVSALFLAGAFGMFYWAQDRGLPLETARTIVVNTVVVFEIFYLFSVRYVHGSALTLAGLVGTPAVLTGVGAVTAGQFLLTYAPFMQDVFATRPLSIVEGVIVVGAGVALLLVVEAEKRIRMLVGP